MTQDPRNFPAASKAAQYAMGYHEATADFQRSMIMDVVNEMNGNLGLAAARLRISRHALRHQMSKLGLARHIGQG